MMRKQPYVALLVELSNAYARQTLHGIRSYIREHGPWTIRFLEQSRGGPPPPWLRRWDGDGILARIENARFAEAIAQSGVPAVDFSSCGLMPSIPSVEVDNRAVADLAAAHLLERGLKHFGYCGVAGFLWSRARGAFFRERLAEAGYPCNSFEPAPRARKLDPWIKDQKELTRWILHLPKPAGVLAAWDGCALQVINTCRHLGFSVPEDVVVLGVDNDDLICDLAVPALSSIDIAPTHIGYLAAELLDRMMAGRGVPAEVYPVKPIGIEIRQSTDMVAIDDPQVSEAVRFIREHACDGINVKDLLKHVPISRTALELRFQRTFGHSPHEEILRVRLDRVKQLLTETALPLSAIAARTGFDHVEYMTVVFKKKTGETPRQFRIRAHHRSINP